MGVPANLQAGEAALRGDVVFAVPVMAFARQGRFKAIAQEAVDDKNAGVGDIVVTAQRREQCLQDVSRSVSDFAQRPANNEIINNICAVGNLLALRAYQPPREMRMAIGFKF